MTCTSDEGDVNGCSGWLLTAMPCRRLPKRDASGVGQVPPGRLPQRRPGQEREGHLCARRAEQVAGRSMCGHGQIIRTGATTDIEQDAIELHPGVADQVEVLAPRPDARPARTWAS